MKGKERQHNYATQMEKEAINGFVLVGIDYGFLQGEDGYDCVATKVGISGYVTLKIVWTKGMLFLWSRMFEADLARMKVIV